MKGLVACAPEKNAFFSRARPQNDCAPFRKKIRLLGTSKVNVNWHFGDSALVVSKSALFPESGTLEEKRKHLGAKNGKQSSICMRAQNTRFFRTSTIFEKKFRKSPIVDERFFYNFFYFCFFLRRFWFFDFNTF